MNFDGNSEAEIRRWLCLRAIEWEAFPAFVTQPIVPVLFIFCPWYSIPLGLLGLNFLWTFVRRKVVSATAANAAALFVVCCKWPAAVGSSLFLLYHREFLLCIVTLVWPFLAGFIPSFGGMVGISELALAKKIGYIPPNVEI